MSDKSHKSEEDEKRTQSDLDSSPLVNSDDNSTKLADGRTQKLKQSRPRTPSLNKALHSIKRSSSSIALDKAKGLFKKNNTSNSTDGASDSERSDVLDSNTCDYGSKTSFSTNDRFKEPKYQNIGNSYDLAESEKSNTLSKKTNENSGKKKSKSTYSKHDNNNNIPPNIDAKDTTTIADMLCVLLDSNQLMVKEQNIFREYHDGKIKEISNKLDDVSNQLTILSDRLVALSSNIASMDTSGLSELQSKLNELQDTQDNLQNCMKASLLGITTIIQSSHEKSNVNDLYKSTVLLNLERRKMLNDLT